MVLVDHLRKLTSSQGLPVTCGEAEAIAEAIPEQPTGLTKGVKSLINLPERSNLCLIMVFSSFH